MNKSFRQQLRRVVPFPLRRWLSAVRALRAPGDAFGRISAGGLHAAISLRADARRWCHVRVGADSIVERGVNFHTNDDGDGPRILIGERCFLGQNCFLSAGELIQIEQDCTIGASCNLLAAGHVYDQPTRTYASATVLSYGRMRLGPNAWIGVGSTLVGNVQVGFGCVVAAGSLLRTALPPLCLAAGHPARIIKVFNWSLQKWIRLPDDEPLRSDALAHHLATLPAQAHYVSQLETRDDDE